MRFWLFGNLVKMMNIFISKTNSKYLLFFLGDDIDGHKRKHRQKTQTQFKLRYQKSEIQWNVKSNDSRQRHRHEMNENTMKTDTEWKLSPNGKACI